jgi:hypothetical protein
MRRIALAILALMLALPLIAAQEKNASKQPTPAEQYQALLQEYNRAASSGKPLTDAERLQFIGQAYKRRFEFAHKFVELAEKYPNDPIAVDALIQAVWQVNTTPWPTDLVGEDTTRPKAFELILRDHIQSDKLGPLCHRVSFGFCKEYETFLRAVLEKNPYQNVQGMACLALGQLLNNRLQRVDLCRQQPETAKEFAGLYGQEYLAELLRQDRVKVIQESETLLERAGEKYSTVKLPYGGTVGDKAKAGLFEIRHLFIGKQAPDIEGEDEDSKPFKLTDYRGKVVLLDFWSYV